MMYVAIYKNKEGITDWKWGESLCMANQLGQDNSDENGFMLCVPLHNYESLERKVQYLEQKLEQVKKYVNDL